MIAETEQAKQTMNSDEINNALGRTAEYSRASTPFNDADQHFDAFEVNLDDLERRHEELALKVDSRILNSSLWEEKMKAMSDEIVAIKARLDSLEALNQGMQTRT